MNPPRGDLHLIPVPLGSAPAVQTLPQSTLAAIVKLDYFIVENEKSARQFLRDAGHPRPLRELCLERFDVNGDAARAAQLLQPLLTGRHAGVLSEAGAPAVADPGASLVEAAHRLAIRVVPHVGPSSLLLALMAAGFNGQRFAFHGYLPVEHAARCREIVGYERESRARDMTQMFIETPYRSDALLQAFLDTCDGKTRLCAASDLTLGTEAVRSAPIAEWKKGKAAIGRRPTVFLLYAR